MAVESSLFKCKSFSEEDACEARVLRIALTSRRLKQMHDAFLISDLSYWSDDVSDEDRIMHQAHVKCGDYAMAVSLNSVLLPVRINCLRKMK